MSWRRRHDYPYSCGAGPPREVSGHGTFAPDQLGPALERLAAPNRVTVTPLRTDARSSGFGVYVGDTGCVHGAVTEKRIWIDVTGHYPETGCVTPPPAH